MKWKDKELAQGDLCTLEENNLKVTMEWIGEGFCGDYEPENPDDIPLIRFSCYRRRDSDTLVRMTSHEFMDGLDWDGIDDASYCTRLPYDTPRKILRRAAGCVIDELSDAIEGGASPKKPLERLSWLCLEDFND